MSEAPSGYQRLTDPTSGRPYWVNLITGQTSWSQPAGSGAVAPSALPPSAGLGAWEERIDPTSGRTFYVDHANKRTTWEDPRAGGGGGGGGGGGYQPQGRVDMPFTAAEAAPRQSQREVASDAELARELAAQWDAEEQSTADVDALRERVASVAKEAGSKVGNEGWASDKDAMHCFLTGVKFTLVNRKHHCRSCGQIFVSEVCKKTAPIPSQGHETPVRVCDICHEQLERGDPVCIGKNVALMREDGEVPRRQGAKALA